MGLDQYAYFVQKQQVKDDFSFAQNRNGGNEDYYWRKNRHLQGWMQDLFEKKGGEGDFNCRYIRLTKDDLDALEKAVNTRDFKDAHGFFWGDRKYDKDQAKYDMNFIRDAKAWIAEGGAVYYTSWW